MRWNCPHCGVGLNVSDDQLGEGWCFSKCYQCSGFSLVRRSDNGAVRVDGTGQTGAGPAIGPGLLEQSPWKLSQRALEATKPVIRPARSRQPSAVQQISKDIQTKKVVVPPPFTTPAPTPAPAAVAAAGIASRPLPPPLLESMQQMGGSRLGRSAFRLVTRALAMGIVGVVGYAAFVWVTTPVPVASQAPATLAKVISTEPSAQTLAVEAPKLSQAVVTDSISRGAMAPDRQKEQQVQASISTSFEIEALSPRVQLRSGPGLQYSVVGTVSPAQKYAVADWSERWFRIVTEKNPDGSAKAYAWVRNDLVKLVTRKR